MSTYIRPHHEILVLLKHLGVNISDIFGADNILWVEGPTEEIIFPKLLSNTLKPGTQICSVKNTGDLDGKKAKLVFNIYSKVSGGNRLIPPAICFIFDSEYKTQKDKDDINRLSKKPVHFLKRVMIENYLINEKALTAIMNNIREKFDISDSPFTTAQITEWITKNYKEKKYYPKLKQNTIESLQYEEDVWFKRIHGASFLEDLFTTFFKSKYKFQKTKDTVDIAFWLLENEINSLEDLKKELSGYLSIEHPKS